MVDMGCEKEFHEITKVTHRLCIRKNFNVRLQLCSKKIKSETLRFKQFT